LEYDEVDKKILELLSRNSRISVREISRIINSSPATISRRIRKLEEKGVIKGYASIIEDEELGYSCRALLLIKTNEGHEVRPIIENIIHNEKICSLFTASGDYKIISTATLNDQKELSDFIEELSKIEGVKEIESVLIESREKILKKVINY